MRIMKTMSLIAVLLVLLPFETSASGAPRSVLGAEPAVVLARVAWKEAGAYVTAPEVAAMHEVLTERARGGGRRAYQAMAWRYSRALRHPRNENVHALGRSPLSAGWPPIFQSEWPRVLAAADASVAGTQLHGCETPGPLVHWGGPHVDRSALRRLIASGYVRARCEGFANAFLARRP